MDYDKMLDKAVGEMPDVVHERKRFEVPNVKGRVEGGNTVLTNFFQIAQHLGRKPEHMLKFLLKELATPGKTKKDKVILGSKVPASKINEKIEKYVEQFVLCKECGKPDTKMEKQQDITYLKCMACGAKYPVKG